MNCQPSFRTGTIPVAGPALDGLGGWAPDAPGGWPYADDPGREEPRRRVPDCDIIDVGGSPPSSRAGDPVDIGDLAFVAESGAVGRPGPGASAQRRNYTKPLLALLILQLAVAGGLHLRKRIAEAQVIVVPATADERAVIT